MAKSKKLSDFRQQAMNANKHTERGMKALEASMNEVGYTAPMIAAADGEIIAGSARHETAANVFGADVEPMIVESDGKRPIVVVRTDIKNAETRAARRIGLLDNRVQEIDLSFDPLVLAQLYAEDKTLTAGLWSDDELTELLNEAAGVAAGDADAEPQIDKAAELNKVWQVKTGDLWQIGEHRLLCGDSTKREDVERVMMGEKAELLHADPPYGMGKEKDGVQNDNLYREKLDVFQMEWWKAFRPSVTDNGSAYIWGNAEDLWRLWYRGGLRDSERLTFRNEIVWDKGYGQGMESDKHRMFPTATERCLFFMLGEQGFNNNADNYWEGWDNIVAYLDTQRQLLGWGIKDAKRIAGHSEKSGCHWFDKSQWSMPTKEVYNAWQAAASGNAFKREYDDLKREHDDLKREHDDLKREFYSTRAYFDNAHDNMTDVWQFPRVTGDDRHDHATPKPVVMMCRAIKSSSSDAGIVCEPFAGSGTTLVACQNLSRKCRGIELSPDYCAVILQRMKDAFPNIEIKRHE